MDVRLREERTGRREIEPGRRMKLMLLVSILAHLGVIYGVLPEGEARIRELDRPGRRVVELRDLPPRRQRPTPPPTRRTDRTRERRRVIPIPDATPDEPEAEYEFEPLIQDVLPEIPEDAVLVFGVPEAPPDLEVPDPNRIYRPGGDVKPPRLLRQVPAEYPRPIRMAGIQGVVELEAVIAPDGRVVDARVTRSLHPLCDASALEAVRQWRYAPATLNAVPVSSYLTVRVTFELR